MAKRIFNGRVIVGGEWKGEAVVSKQGFNTLASCQKSAMSGKKIIVCSDQNNPEIYGKQISGKALCLPITIGSTTGGLILQTLCALGANPSVMLFSGEADSLAMSGIVLASVWETNKIIGIDKLGTEFLDYVKSGYSVFVKEDGTVVVETPLKLEIAAPKN